MPPSLVSISNDSLLTTISPACLLRHKDQSGYLDKIIRKKVRTGQIFPPQIS